MIVRLTWLLPNKLLERSVLAIKEGEGREAQSAPFVCNTVLIIKE